MNPAMTIRRARPEDADMLTAVAHAAKRHWGYPERWIVAWRDDLTVTSTFVRSHTAFAAIDGDAVLGFYALARREATCSVEHFWIRPEAMGRGIGRALFEHAVAQATASGARQLEIEADPNAVGFYERMGARRVGETVYELEGRPRVLPLLMLDLPPRTATSLTA